HGVDHRGLVDQAGVVEGGLDRGDQGVQLLASLAHWSTIFDVGPMTTVRSDSVGPSVACWTSLRSVTGPPSCRWRTGEHREVRLRRTKRCPLVRSPAARSWAATVASASMADRVPLAHLPTPLEPMDRLGQHLGMESGALWVKRDDATGLAGGGNKARKLEY